MGITHVLLPRRTPIYAFFAVRSPGGQLKWIEYGIMPFSDCKAEHYTLLVRVHRLFATFRACERQVEVQYTFFFDSEERKGSQSNSASFLKNLQALCLYFAQWASKYYSE